METGENGEFYGRNCIVCVLLTFKRLQKNLPIAGYMIATISLDAIGFTFLAFYRHFYWFSDRNGLHCYRALGLNAKICFCLLCVRQLSEISEQVINRLSGSQSSSCICDDHHDPDDDVSQLCNSAILLKFPSTCTPHSLQRQKNDCIFKSSFSFIRQIPLLFFLFVVRNVFFVHLAKSICSSRKSIQKTTNEKINNEKKNKARY